MQHFLLSLTDYMVKELTRLIRKDLYGDYVVTMNEVVIDEKMLNISASFNDPRFNIFTKEELATFEKIYREHMEIIYGDKYSNSLLR